jgi:hypothetical protein
MLNPRQIGVTRKDPNETPEGLRTKMPRSHFLLNPNFKISINEKGKISPSRNHQMETTILKWVIRD